MRHTDDTLAKLSKMRRGDKNPFYGRKHSEEFKRAQSERTRAYNATRKYEASPQSVTIPNDVAFVAYLAGMIDADGSIRFRRRVRPFVCVYNTHAGLLEWIKTRLGHGSIYKTTSGREQVECWQITAARDVFAIITAIYPYLIVKRADADTVLEFLKGKYEWARQPE